MDDPIFDPWSAGAPDGPPRAETSDAVKGSEPSDAVPTGPRWSAPATSRGTPRARSRRTPRSRPIPARAPQRPVPGEQPRRKISSRASRQPSPVAHRVRTLAVPYLEALSARVAIAGHRTLIDDRLDADLPTLRFRLVPRAAPFDERAAVAGSVLELVVDGRKVRACFWLDPLAEDPATERIADDGVRSAWVEGVCLDFVARTLEG